MPTTSPELIATVVTALDRQEPEWCVLHREAELLSGDVTSDVDTLVSRDPRLVAAELSHALASRDVLLIQSWEYDQCERSNVFVSLDPPESVQLDLVLDPKGRGVCGYRSPVLLSHAEAGARWPTLAAPDSILYRTRKRQVKRNVKALAELRAERARFDSDVLKSRAAEVFEPYALKALLALLDDPRGLTPVGWLKGPQYYFGVQVRRYRRLLRPPGFVVVVPRECATSCRELARSLDRFIVNATAIEVRGIYSVVNAFVRTRKPSVTVVADSTLARLLGLIAPTVRLRNDADPVSETLRAMHEGAVRSLYK